MTGCGEYASARLTPGRNGCRGTTRNAAFTWGCADRGGLADTRDAHQAKCWWPLGHFLQQCSIYLLLEFVTQSRAISSSSRHG